MNRFLLFLCFLCIPWVARGQAAYNWLYWFDDDDANRRTGISQGGEFNIQTDASQLSEGFHAFHMQVADTAGRFSPPFTELFYHVADHTVNSLRYWFNNDVEHVYETASTGGRFTIDVAALEPGLHYVFCQAKDSRGNTSDVKSAVFYRQTRMNAMKWTYWFDEEQQTTTVNNPGEAVMIDVSVLEDGFHTLHSQLSETSASDVVSSMFIKIPQTERVGNMTVICLVDNKVIAEEKLPAKGGFLQWNMNVDSIDVGIHKAMFQVITPSGAASNIAERYFVRMITNHELSSMKCVYTIDNNATYSQAGSLSNGLFHFDLDVAALDDGLHRLSYMLMSKEGITTAQKTAFFWKAPLGGSGIVQYDYWVNDDGPLHSVKLDSRTNPFRLISLLPVETMPIRSSCFHFAVEDGTPVLYAKNDFHVRFYDTTAKSLNETRQYVDQSVKQEVTDVTLLESGKRQTTAKLEENEIKWFKFYAEEGDTVTFRTDQAATLQVFSPEGKEIYSASGSTSVVYGGCHTWTDGTYYVALHDVTGSKPNTSLDFTHLAKYDVVSYDIAAVGNGGCSTITFKGNGFRDLYAVDFVNEANDSIHAFSIGHESDGTTSVTADFTDATTGKYTALFHFTEGKKYVYDAVTVEDAVPIELATEVTFPRSFGHVVTYTCKITNSGNMTAYAVPIYTWMKSKTKDGIYNIKYDGLNLPSIFDLAEMDSLTPEEIKTLRVFSDKMSDDHYFLKIWTEDEDNPGDSVYVRSNYFFTNIAPYETKILRLTLSTREVDTYAYFTVPEDWLAVSMSEKMAGKSRRAKDKGYCCIRDNIECAVNAVAVTMDMAAFASWMATIAAPESGVAEIAALFTSVLSCATSVLNAGLKPINTVICNAIDQDHNPLDNIGNSINGFSVIGAITSCFSGSVSLFKEFFELTKTEQFVTDGLLNTMVSFCDISGGGYECSSYVSKQPGCPPPPPGGGNSGGGQSHDPNEIYGYLSDAGSHFMTDSVKKVSYRIEFENDTAFATRSAMVVEIRDTLNRQQFDLSSYAPTGIKIGEKVEYLEGEPNFVKTIDMRPEINGLVEVAGSYDVTKGIMDWKFTSLDPMTMEPTNDPMQGFLPVNYDGKSGIGEVTYDIALKVGLKHQTEIPNRASIVFDVNEPIMTPTWTNIIDRIAPVSRVTDIVVKNDSTARVLTDLFDGLSGPWRYDVYVQYGEGSAWWKAAENVPADSIAEVRIYEGINHGFYVLATDSAGNVERKEAIRECTLYNGEVTTAIEETPVNKQHGIRLDGTLLTVSTECGWVQQVNVVNMAGQAVVQKGTMQNGTAIDLSRLPTGAYTVTATGCGEKLSRKILLRTEQ